MSDIVLVDTDILMDAGRGIPEAVDCLQQVDVQSSLAISVVTYMELLVGCRNKAELRATERFLKRFHVVKLSEPISDQAIELLRSYRLSHGLLIADALIAATAMAWDAAVVSKNQDDIVLCRVFGYWRTPSHSRHQHQNTLSLDFCPHV